jgi:hypothetical protein
VDWCFVSAWKPVLGQQSGTSQLESHQGFDLSLLDTDCVNSFADFPKAAKATTKSAVIFIMLVVFSSLTALIYN